MVVQQPTTKQTAHPLAKKRRTTFIALLILLVVTATISLMVGPVRFTLAEIWHGLTVNDETLERRVVWELRFPRVIIGMLVGACLAIAGAILQAIMRNPLADPGIIGVSSGGGIAAITVMIIFPVYLNLLPIAAFLGFSITGILGGSVFIETIFGFPGMGQLFIQSIMGRDYSVITALVMLYGFLALLGSLLSDIILSIVDPRIRIE